MIMRILAAWSYLIRHMALMVYLGVRVLACLVGTERNQIKPSHFHTFEKGHIHDLYTVRWILLRWKTARLNASSDIKKTLS